MQTGDEAHAAPEDVAAWREDIRSRALSELERAPPPRYWRWYAIALILPLLLHLGLLSGLRNAMRKPPRSDNSVVQVILLNPESPPPMPVPPPLLARANTPDRIGSSAAVSSESTPAAQVSAHDATGPMPRIFNSDGSIRLPPAPATITPFEAGLARGRELLARGHNMLHCRRSQFDTTPSPEQAGIDAGKAAEIVHLVMGNPLDPLNDVGNAQNIAAAREMAAERRAVADQVCDD